MGFELDRLMKQFGVATPSLNYSGTGVPINPGVRVTQLLVEVLTTALPPPSPTTVEYVQPTFRGTNRGIARGII